MPAKSVRDADHFLLYLGVSDDTKRFSIQKTTAATVFDSRCVGQSVLLSVVLFLSFYSYCADDCTAADKQEGDPKSHIAGIAGLWICRFACVRFVFAWCCCIRRQVLDFHVAS